MRDFPSNLPYGRLRVPVTASCDGRLQSGTAAGEARYRATKGGHESMPKSKQKRKGAHYTPPATWIWTTSGYSKLRSVARNRLDLVERARPLFISATTRTRVRVPENTGPP
jgi:hypothetical protein